MPYHIIPLQYNAKVVSEYKQPNQQIDSKTDVLQFMNQYRICLATIGIAVLSIGMTLNRLYAAIIVIASFICWVLTNLLIPKLSQYMLKAQVFGYDINKKGSEQGEKKIPQCIGFACAIGFIIIGYFYYPYGDTNPNSILEKVNIHSACMVTILSTVLLGFADDMIDLPWRYKLIFPFLFMVPVIRAYTGSTAVLMPWPASMLFGNELDLGYLFYLYIIMLGIYFTNAINIYAGINGLEVGQSIIAACSQLVLFSVRAVISGDSSKYEYSSFLLLCFLGSALAIMKYNAFPSQVFVGDTFCYYAGIVLALSAVFSQISIAVHFLFIPQLINFLYSCPQLFGFVACPRHRLTVYNPKTDQLTGVSTNMNLLNLSLAIIGPTNEGVLCKILLLIQIVTSAIGVAISAYFM